MIGAKEKNVQESEIKIGGVANLEEHLARKALLICHLNNNLKKVRKPATWI